MKRGVGIAMQVCFGNLGGVIAAFVYLSKDQPRYVLISRQLIDLNTNPSFLDFGDGLEAKM
jgi:hypothetical protein